MEKQESNERDLRQKLFELRRQSRERYLQLVGVDIKALRALEREVDGRYGELAEALQKMRREEGKERAERHSQIREATRTALSQDADRALHAEFRTTAAILDHLGIERLEPPFLPPFWWYHCHYATWLSTNLGYAEEITLDPPTGGGGVGTVNHDSAENQAQPYVSVSGQGTGTVNSVLVKASYKFSFTPGSDASYCIRPMVFMNGWWLLWTWGACGGTSEDLGSGNLRVKLRVRVDQLSAPVKQIEHTVVDRTLAGGGSEEGAVDYASESDSGSRMTVALVGGHEAVIFVECEVLAQLYNHGRAIIDMQSGSGFYFRVPEVAIGRRHHHWPWQIPALEALGSTG